MNCDLLRRIYHRLLMILMGGCSFFWGATASGQLTWGTGGNGGSGTWNTTTSNWWNGSANVSWTNGGSAVFAGVGGTVTSVFPGPTASNITFDAPGYTIQSGWINASGSSLTITTNQAATISSTLSDSVSNGVLVKNGAATLAVSGTNFIDTLQVNAGEYLVGGTSSLFFSNVNLANAAGAVVTLGQTSPNTNMKSLSGGGVAGGILQPNNQARTVKVTLFASGTFRGVVQDNGSGKLALDIFGSANTTTLTGANTHSGATSLTFGTLVLAGNGSALNSPVSVLTGSTLRLDNSTTALANRLSDSAEVTMQNGRIEYVGHSTTPVEEQLGPLKFSGAVSVSNSQPGSAAALLTFASATRQNNATIDFGGNGRTKWNGMANDPAGMVGAYATAGNEWATVGGDGRVDALASYAADINGAAPGEHVKIAGGGTTSLAASATRSTLNLQNSSGSAGTLDLGAGHTLTLGDGGILSSGTATNRVQSGTLRASGNELVVTNRNALTIDSNIGESVAGTGLTKSGAGSLTLTGTNSYSGNTVIDQGSLVVSSDANLGTGSTIQFNGGSLLAAQSFNSTKGLSKGTDLVGTIDTGGNNVAFSGANTGAISKTGAGTLTLSNPAPGSVSVTQGTLALTNPTSGSATLQGGTLLAAGTLSNITLSSSSTLDIGGNIAAALTTTTFLTGGSSGQALTVRFGLGLNVKDLWTITNPVSSFSLSTGAFLFDFQDLGGATTGTNYTLMNVQASGPPLTLSMFGFAPSATAAGWDGTFSVVSNTVRVNLTSTPEPGSATLLLIGGLICSGRRAAREFVVKLQRHRQHST